ncbi:hypothetical protein [Bradyrhizobium liaoningense]
MLKASVRRESFSESVEGMQALIENYLAPLLIGEDASRIDFHIHRINELIAGASFAKAAVEMALWDARGKSMGQNRMRRSSLNRQPTTRRRHKLM